MVAVMARKPTTRRFFEITSISKTIDRYPILTIDEERAVTRRYFYHRRRDDFDLLVNSNLRFVLKTVMEFKSLNFSIGDLMQEGVLGLMRAIEKFNPENNFRLVTYAAWWIRAYIQRYVQSNWSLAKVCKTHAERKLFSSLVKAERELTAAKQNGVAATVDELAAYLRVPAADVERMSVVMHRTELSLDIAGIAEDLLIDDRYNQEALLSTRINDHRISRLVRKYINKLPDQEREIIRLRFLQPQGVMKLKDIGELFGFTKERARQVIESGLKRMKRLMEEDGVAIDDLEF